MAALPAPKRDDLQTPGALHENIEQLQQFVSQDPRVAAQVIKEWVGSE
jgi:flagellar biosynthesis/type III secretory pathway M-ring protein FliF/YscJ